MNYMEAAFAPAEARYAEAVRQDSWGHLAPKRGETYRGVVVYALGCLGSDRLNPTVLALEMKSQNEELDSSPWLFDSVMDMLGELGGEAGCVYEVRATFRNYRWWTSRKEIYRAPGAGD